MATNRDEKDQAINTPSDHASPDTVINNDRSEDIQASRTRQSEVERFARPRSSCLSEALQQEQGTKQMVDRKIVRQRMLNELDDSTKENILRAKYTGRPCVVEGGLYLISTLETPAGEAKLRRIASTRSVHPEKLQNVPGHTW